MARLRIRLEPNEAVRINRVALGADRLVYILAAEKRIQYPKGKSRIAYIGTTKKGIQRLTSSVAYRAGDILYHRQGIYSFTAHIVTCTSLQRVKTWHKLERALLLTFRDEYRDVPICNKHGSKMKRTDEDRYFTTDRLKRILTQFS